MHLQGWLLPWLLQQQLLQRLASSTCSTVLQQQAAS
jgi:hypothetical protein